MPTRPTTKWIPVANAPAPVARRRGRRAASQQLRIQRQTARLRRVVAHVAGEPDERERLGRLDPDEALPDRAQQERVHAVEERVV